MIESGMQEPSTGEPVTVRNRRAKGNPVAAAAQQDDIYTALVEFQKEMPTVQREATGQARGGKYKYADLTSIVKEVTPILTKHGLSFTCRPRRCDDGTYETVGVIMHTTGQYIEGALPVFGHSPQEVGSSLTYNRRYLLGNLTGIVTDEDDDGAAAQARPTQMASQTSPLNRAKEKVATAWRDTHGGEFDADAMRDDYASRYQRDIGDANVKDLEEYTKALLSASAEAAFGRALGAEPQEPPA